MIDIIKVPYTTSPHMMRYDGEIFNSNPSSVIIEQKKKELRKYGALLYGFSDDKKPIKDAAKFCGYPNTGSIVELALNFEEDVAIMHQGKLNAICFCFPSSWEPGHRIGLSLEQIHEPVADGDKLRTASSRIAEIMATQGPFRRHVWTLSNSGEMSQLPENKSDKVPQSIDDLYFRVETQTTVPIGDSVTSLFFVKVETFPLKDLWENEKFRQKLIASIDSMSESVLIYKHLKEIKNLICGYSV